ncbi:hypothetical protein NBRC10512_007408 [Rhodotorula toruloides]|uniref:RHTO0S12e03158g1_1 n=2 Tax=Rhodotorula toruloides TaxID=5286 RepID=A0A061B8T5_RHOTO|nr:uncharacterized protein RHTO_07542 [Rhodotorula toruloides NP11]EMS23200.1 hypothetical protein RHTO_07542 [Rhodotorula toruloides NP11]CDR46330.1 RHTO0S12e03158g1_1 [Rhodotorula toruloides]
MQSLDSAAHPVLPKLVPLSDFHPIRIASHTKITLVVQFALDHLRRNEDEPLVLHCLPPSTSSSSANAGRAGPLTSTQPDSNPSPAPDPTPPAAKGKGKGKATESPSSTSVAALPKLVSIAEIIKREWLDVELKHATGDSIQEDTAAPAREGLHQYTLLTTLEAIDLASDTIATDEVDGDVEEEEMRRQLIEMEWLSGRAGKDRRPRRKHSPCMLVILSRAPTEALASRSSWTHQPPAPPVPRTTKRRATSENATAPEGGTAKRKTRRRRR